MLSYSNILYNTESKEQSRSEQRLHTSHSSGDWSQRTKDRWNTNLLNRTHCLRDAWGFQSDSPGQIKRRFVLGCGRCTVTIRLCCCSSQIVLISETCLSARLLAVSWNVTKPPLTRRRGERAPASHVNKPTLCCNTVTKCGGKCSFHIYSHVFCVNTGESPPEWIHDRG